MNGSLSYERETRHENGEDAVPLQEEERQERNKDARRRVVCGDDVFLSKDEMLKGLKCVFGKEGTYKCPKQREMLEMTTERECPRGSFHVGLPCGSGKSMAWVVPALARVLSGKAKMTQMVVVPFIFLGLHHVNYLNSITKKAGMELECEFFRGVQIQREGVLPDCLRLRPKFPRVLLSLIHI